MSVIESDRHGYRFAEGVKYRVEVEGDCGPFEVAKGPPEWFSVR